MHPDSRCPDCIDLGSMRARYDNFDLYWCGGFLVAVASHGRKTYVSHILRHSNEPANQPLKTALARYIAYQRKNQAR